MSNFFEALKQYFEVTPREKVLEDWAKSAEFDEVGPSVEEFLKQTTQYFPIQAQDPLCANVTTQNIFNPKFTSGFLMHFY